MKNRYRIRKYSILWFMRGAAVVCMAVIIICMAGMGDMPADEPAMEEEVISLPVNAEIYAPEAPEEPEELEPFFFLTAEDRDLVERVVAAEGRGECIEGQMAIAQTIGDRCITTNQSITNVCTSHMQFADPYMGDISDTTKDAVSYVFDGGVDVLEFPVTHFYAWKLIEAPEWTSGLELRGEIGGTRFYGEAVK